MRYALLLGYVLLSTAGAAALAWTPPTVHASTSGRFLTGVWSVFLILGGALALYGVLAEQWTGEYLGLPLLVTAFLTYAWSIATSTRGHTHRESLYPLLALLLGVVGLLVDRWREVRVTRRAALQTAHRRRTRGSP